MRLIASPRVAELRPDHPNAVEQKTNYQQHLRHENHTVALRRRSPAEEPTPTPLVTPGSAGGKWSCPALREASRDD